MDVGVDVAVGVFVAVDVVGYVRQRSLPSVTQPKAVSWVCGPIQFILAFFFILHEAVIFVQVTVDDSQFLNFSRARKKEKYSSIENFCF